MTFLKDVSVTMIASVFLTGNYYHIPGQQDPLLCGNSSDAGYGLVTLVEACLKWTMVLLKM